MAMSDSSRALTKQQVSAGGIVCRRRGGGVEVVLVSVSGPDGQGGAARWALPKGLVAPGESHEAAALREVGEETGLACQIVAPVAPIEYWYWGREGEQRTRYHKRVYFFMMTCVSGDIADHDWEVDEVRWYPLAEAAQRASFRSERHALAEMAGLVTRLPEGESC